MSSSLELRRPLGLALSGGGALGAWQAGALAGLCAAGLRFDAVLGFSAGALNGAAYALGRLDDALARWNRLDGGVLKLAPRLRPPSLFSDRFVRAHAADFAGDESAARAALLCPLTVVAARIDRSTRVYARFERQGSWDGPLAGHLRASCAIPLAFPRVTLDYRGAPTTLFDGGVHCDEAMSFSALAHCRDVIVLEVVRQDEVGQASRGLFGELETRSRETIRRLMSQGAASLRPAGARVLRLAPSRALTGSLLDFRGARMREAVALGEQDARAFLSSPAAA